MQIYFINFNLIGLGEIRNLYFIKFRGDFNVVGWGYILINIGKKRSLKYRNFIEIFYILFRNNVVLFLGILGFCFQGRLCCRLLYNFFLF